MKARLGSKIVFFLIYIIIYVHYHTYTYLDNHLHIPNPPSSFHQLTHKQGHLYNICERSKAFRTWILEGRNVWSSLLFWVDRCPLPQCPTTIYYNLKGPSDQIRSARVIPLESLQLGHSSINVFLISSFLSFIF
jgi:hypothetical protein